MICEQIIQAIHGKRTTTGVLATAIYLGQSTKSLMRNEVDVMMHVDNLCGGRMMFEGIPVYTVDEEYYLAVS